MLTFGGGLPEAVVRFRLLAIELGLNLDAITASGFRCQNHLPKYFNSPLARIRAFKSLAQRDCHSRGFAGDSSSSKYWNFLKFRQFLKPRLAASISRVSQSLQLAQLRVRIVAPFLAASMAACRWVNFGLQ